MFVRVSKSTEKSSPRTKSPKQSPNGKQSPKPVATNSPRQRKN